MSTSHIMHTYASLDIAFSYGRGIELFDLQGKRYFDAISGIATCSLGHAHPAVTQAITEQCQKLIHCSNIYQIPAQQELAAVLCALANMDNAFFCNSGAEANEAAIKIARKYANDRAIQGAKIITLNNSFHGRTQATLSASGNPKIQAGFTPLQADFIHLDGNDSAALRKVFAQHPVAAVMLEPTQGEGGIYLLDSTYLQDLAKLCVQHNSLLILDEIQTGNGRTGSYFAFQQMGIEPDIVTTAKGLGNGFPIGVCLAKGKAAQVFSPGNHGSTFGGNPLACATALSVVNTIQQQKLAEHAGAMGKLLLQGLTDKLASQPGVIDIRGHGLMIGIELQDNCGELVILAAEQGLLINVTAQKVVRLLPALIISQQQIKELIDALSTIIINYLQNKR